MKVYVAGKWEQRGVIAAFMRRLKTFGVQVAHNWTVESEEGLDGEARRRYLRTCAEDDVDGVLHASAVVIFDHPLGRGLFVEMGIALGRGLRRDRIIVVGAEGHLPIFYHLAGIRHVATADEAITELLKLAQQDGEDEEGCF